MKDFKKINQFFQKLDEVYLRQVVPSIIAEKATEYFKQRFTTKEWDGNSWPPTKKPVTRGSLMVRSGALVNSIKPKLVTPHRVVISAGSSKVPYARAHNEGETIQVPVTEKMRKFAWAMHYEENKDDTTVDGPWKGLALTKKDRLTIHMPQRRFMGHSERLNEVILTALKEAFKDAL